MDYHGIGYGETGLLNFAEACAQPRSVFFLFLPLIFSPIAAIKSLHYNLARKSGQRREFIQKGFQCSLAAERFLLYFKLKMIGLPLSRIMRRSPLFIDIKITIIATSAGIV